MPCCLRVPSGNLTCNYTMGCAKPLAVASKRARATARDTYCLVPRLCMPGIQLPSAHGTSTLDSAFAGLFEISPGLFMGARDAPPFFKKNTDGVARIHVSTITSISIVQEPLLSVLSILSR